MRIKALTIKPPWSAFIAAGLKTVENRSWRTPYRGPLAIHSGKSWDSNGERIAERIMGRAVDIPAEYRVGEGFVAVVADLTGICAGSTGSRFVRCECGPWAVAGQFHWQLTNVRPLPERFPASGRQQLWSIDLPDFPIGGAR